MPDQSRRIPGILLLSAVTFATTSLARVSAQEAEEPAGNVKKSSGITQGSTAKRLFLVVEAEEGKKADDIRKTVTTGLSVLKEENPSVSYGAVRVLPVSSAIYRGMKALIQGEPFEASLEGQGQPVRLIPGGKSTWEIGTGDAFARAKSIKLFFEKKENGKLVETAEPVTYEAAALNQQDKPFRFHSAGTYILSLDKERPPSRYEMEMFPDPNGQARPPVRGEWPAEVPYYLLSIDDFDAKQDDLFTILKQPQKVGDAFKEIKAAESATISLGSLKDFIPPPVTAWNGKTYRMSVTRPEQLFPTRAWVYFPVYGDDAKKKQEELSKEFDKGPDAREKFLKDLAKKSGSGVKDSAAITIASPPEWYEIPADALPAGSSPNDPPKAFSRAFEVNAGPANATVPDGPAYGLVIWDFKGDQILRVGNSRIQQIEHPQWSEGARLAAPKKDQ